MHWGDYGHSMGYGWGMGFGWLFMFIMLILLILCVIYMAKLIGGPTKRGEMDSTPLQILKKRYAKGEITKDEYESIKKDM